MEYIRLGTIQKPFGLAGQVRCRSLTSFAAKRFRIGSPLTLWNEKTGERENVTVSFFRDSGDFYFLGFAGHDRIEDIERYLGWHIEIRSEDAPLPSGYYRLTDLIGSKAIDAKTGREIGVVEDVLSNAAASNLKLRETDGKTCYIPFVMKEFIVSIDIEKREIAVNVIPGLL